MALVLGSVLIVAAMVGLCMAATGRSFAALRAREPVLGIGVDERQRCTYVYWAEEGGGDDRWESPTTYGAEEFEELVARNGDMSPGSLLFVLDQPELSALAQGLCAPEEYDAFAPLSLTGVNRQQSDRHKRFSSNSAKSSTSS